MLIVQELGPSPIDVGVPDGVPDSWACPGPDIVDLVRGNSVHMGHLSLFFLFISNSIQTKREVKCALGLKSRRKCPHECVCIHIYLDKVALDWNGSG